MKKEYSTPMTGTIEAANVEIICTSDNYKPGEENPDGGDAAKYIFDSFDLFDFE